MNIDNGSLKGMTPELRDLIEKGKKLVESMTPVELALMHADQTASMVRSIRGDPSTLHIVVLANELRVLKKESLYNFNAWRDSVSQADDLRQQRDEARLKIVSLENELKSLRQKERENLCRAVDDWAWSWRGSVTMEGLTEYAAEQLKQKIFSTDENIGSEENLHLDTSSKLAMQRALSSSVKFISDDKEPVVTVTDNGLYVEWHAHGMNIELRLRFDYTYALVEDARGIIPYFSGSDGALRAVILAYEEMERRNVER